MSYHSEKVAEEVANCSEGVAGHPVKGPWPPLWPPPEEVAQGVAKGWPMLVGYLTTKLHSYEEREFFRHLTTEIL